MPGHDQDSVGVWASSSAIPPAWMQEIDNIKDIKDLIPTNTEINEDIPPIFGNIEKVSDERTKQVKHLLNLNHTNYSILYNNYRFQNHTPHFLGSAYLFGGSSAYLQAIYDDLLTRDSLEPWRPSPGVITLANHRAYLGKGEYQRAWVDFFEEMLSTDEYGNNWRRVARDFLFETGKDGEVNSAPMFRCLNTALGHPLIHLGYAYELNSRELASEALGLIATCYDEKFAALLTVEPNDASIVVSKTSDLFELFRRISDDKVLPTFRQPGDEHIAEILAEQRYVDIVISYINSWDITYPVSQLSQAYYFVSLLLASTSPRTNSYGYDFFLVHLLTTAHAVRVLFPFISADYHSSLLKSWLLTAVLAYIAQNRPKLNLECVKEFDLKGRDWEHVRTQAIKGKYSMDAHFVKACRALWVANKTWNGRHADKDGDGNEDESEIRDRGDGDWFLKCAVKFVREFDGWGGFDIEAEDAELVKGQRRKDGIHVR